MICFKRKILILILSILFFTGCDIIDPPEEYTYSFEQDLEDWQIRRVDIEHDPDTIFWHIVRVDSMSTDGAHSLEFFLDNWNDAGKIWIEREFVVDPQKRYDVEIAFDLASSDFTQTNLFKIVAGAGPSPPVSPEEITQAFQDNTYNGGTQGWVWMEKEYELKATSDSEGRLYVFIGIWGTWETPRTYFLDNLNVKLN